MSSPLIQPGWSRPESPFHEGELAVQERVGVTQKMDQMGRRFIRDYMPDQHREFFEKIPFVFTGLVDEEGQPWASMLLGYPGFIHSHDEKSLRINARPLPADPVGHMLRNSADIGLVGVELPTRRRNRMNGTIQDAGADGFTVKVVHSFGNCPQYIQSRDFQFIRDPADADAQVRTTYSSALDQRACKMIAGADTFIIASAHQDPTAGTAKGIDVSHRGGHPGFVRVDDGGTLTAPDFVGNFLFNTLGNLTIDPRAGLLFIDFTEGDLLYLAVRAEIVWDGPEVKAFAGAERLLRFNISKVIHVESVLPIRWAAPTFSPLLERTGSWEDVARNIDAARERDVWRDFTISNVHDESETIRSFTLVPMDGGGLPAYEPGQHLPLRLSLKVNGIGAVRPYSLSAPFNGRSYTISVKRVGAVSGWLHDHAKPGVALQAKAPRGNFTFRMARERPVVFVSAGVGITPMMAMLRSLLVNDGRTRHHGQIYFVHAARNARELAFNEELVDLAKKHSNLRLHIYLSRAEVDDVSGSSYLHPGRVDVSLLQTILPLDDYDFYLCGPALFMQGIYDGLRRVRVTDERIWMESFGIGSVRRSRAAPASAAAEIHEEGIEVKFARSKKVAHWRPRDGTLLDLAEANGLSPLHGCRGGTCGACATSLSSGDVDYLLAPDHEPLPGEVLICCSVPRPGPHKAGRLDREGITLDI